MMVPGNSKTAELHALISVIKPITSWAAYNGIAECRRACGGLGFSYYSKFSTLLSGNDVNQTWEGDNNVLLQQTAKFLLDCYKQKMKDKMKPTQTCEWVTTDDVTEDKCEATTIDEFLQFDNLKKVFEYRCNKLLQRTAMSLAGKTMGKTPDEQFKAWNDSQVFGCQDLALAYGEQSMVLFDIIFLKKLDVQEKKYFNQVKADTKESLLLLFRLSTLQNIMKDIGTWYENGYLTADHGDMIREEIKNILPKISRFAINLTDAMKPREEETESMIAPSDGDLYKSIANKIFTAPKTF